MRSIIPLTEIYKVLALLHTNMPLNQQAQIEEDGTLLAKICLQDKIALAQLYERYVDRMLGLACHILGNQDDAEEIIHDVFIEIWNKAKDYNEQKASVIGWMLLRVRSRCLDRIRKSQTMKKYLEKQTTEVKIQSKSSLDAYTDNKMIKKSLKVLSEKQRLIIDLNYFKGLSCAEISQSYGIPLGTVKTRLLSAMKKMQASLSKEGS